MSEVEIPPIASAPKPRRGWFFWSSTGCLGITILGAIAIWWLKSFIGDHLILDFDQAAVVAEEIIQVNLPEGFSYNQAFSHEQVKIAWATEEDASPTSPIIMLVWSKDDDVREDNVLEGFERNRTRGEDATYLRTVSISWKNQVSEITESEYEDGRKEYIMIQPANPGMIMIVFAGPPEIVTTSWVTTILNGDQ